MKKVKILNVQFDVCTKDDALARVFDLLTTRHRESGKQIVTPNPEMILEAQHNKKFGDVLNYAWLSIPDGIGVLWAATFQRIAQRSNGILRFVKAFFSLSMLAINPAYCRKIFQERITGVDFMESVCSMSRKTAQRDTVPVFLLGAEPGIAEKVKNILEIRYPGVEIVGTSSASPSPDDSLAIEAQIAETRPEILFVAYGSPHQEMWIAEHLPNLKSVKIAMGVGGAFDFIAGKRSRAPRWMQRTGLEWLYRLFQEPHRMRRIANATVKFPLAVINSKNAAN